MSPNIFLFLIVLGVATFRFSLLISEESGPFKIFEHIRTLFGITENDIKIPSDYGYIDATEIKAHNQLGKLILCPHCLSGWVSFVLSLVFLYFTPYQVFFVYWMSIWGISYLLITVVKRDN